MPLLGSFDFHAISPQNLRYFITYFFSASSISLYLRLSWYISSAEFSRGKYCHASVQSMYALEGSATNLCFLFLLVFLYFISPPKKSAQNECTNGWVTSRLKSNRELSERKRVLRLMTTLHLEYLFFWSDGFPSFVQEKNKLPFPSFHRRGKKKQTSIFEKKMVFWKPFWVSEKSLSVSSFFLNCYQVNDFLTFLIFCAPPIGIFFLLSL